MRTKVPGSAANLGPGFDTLALALELYVEVEVSPSESLVIEAEGHGSELPQDSTHLAARVAKRVIGHDNLHIRVNSEIPVARGLGSSAALAVATAAAVGADDPLAIATEFEGHPENAAASVMGGLVTVASVDGVPVATPLFLDPDLSFVLVVPDRTLETPVARKALPKSVSLADATFNLGRLGWLIAALGDSSGLKPEAMDDRLHQNQRTPLFPESKILIDSLIAAGASAACWSGAGPSLLALCIGDDCAQRVSKAAGQSMKDARVSGFAQVVASDRGGLQID